MNTVCSTCGGSFIRTHTCKTGSCTDGGEFRRNLSSYMPGPETAGV